MSYYKNNDFINACSNDPKNVIPIGNVLRDASEDFNLRTKSNLLKFISNNGLEDLQFINTKNWEKNPNKSNPIKVDAYEFRTMDRLGYIAFFYNDKTNKWIIKSFHLSDNRNPTMMIALQKAGLMPLEDKNEK